MTVVYVIVGWQKLAGNTNSGSFVIASSLTSVEMPRNRHRCPGLLGAAGTAAKTLVTNKHLPHLGTNHRNPVQVLEMSSAPAKDNSNHPAVKGPSALRSIIAGSTAGAVEIGM